MRTNTWLGIALALMLCGCNATKTTTTTSLTQTKTQTQTNNEEAFCQALLAQSVKEGENAFLSPASAAMALNILTPGAAGTTLGELQQVIPDVKVDTTQWLNVASALWINEGLNVKPAFFAANASAEVYHGRIEVDKVNRWASEKTNGKVTKVLSEPLPPIQMAITNALHFKADWAEPFMAQNTHKEDFFGKTAKRQVNMMHQTAHFQYIQTKQLQAIRLYYAAPYCMDVILPKKGVRLEDATALLQDASKTLQERGEEKKVALALPKFKLEYEKQLNDYLKAMGLKTCFTKEADFSGISTTPLYVDFIKQNTFLSIDELGTEAAAVTTIGLAKMAYRPEKEEIIPMTVDHPFVLFIRDTNTNQVLFYGLIQDIQE